MDSVRILCVALLGLVGWSCVATTCPEPSRPKANVSLQPGQYDLVLRATEGSRAGVLVRGTLWLRQTDSVNRDPLENPLYGWLRIDLSAVGAPVLAGEGPDPASTDPNAPGVLVHLVDWDNYPPHTPILSVGTDSNSIRRHHKDDGTEVIVVSTDGAGIGLWVHEAQGDRLFGRWREWGIVADGRGVFCATRVGETPANRTAGARR